MKLFYSVLFVCATAQYFEIDWDNIRSKKINFGFSEDFKVEEEARIVGGNVAFERQFPYQAAIISLAVFNQFFCGGSLISAHYVLTAAHCVDSAYIFHVILGAHNIREKEPSQIRMTTTLKTVHPEWNHAKVINDIALLELPHPVILNEYIQIVRLPSRSQEHDSFIGYDATVSGWGRVRDKSRGSSYLRFETNPILANEECEDGMFNLGLIKDTHICQSSQGKKSSCSGDSGGPLVIDEDGGPIEVGIVSFGLKFGCEKEIPSAYTRLTKYLDWIEQNSDVHIRP